MNMTDNGQTGKIIRRKAVAANTEDNQLMDLFATVPLGAEQLTCAELSKLGVSNLSQVRGGVAFSGDKGCLYRCLMQLRTASRLLVKLAEFPCSSPQELYDGIRSLDWSRHLTPAMTLAINCTLRDSNITHSYFAALKAKDAIVDQLRDKTGNRPNIDTKTPDLRINLHIAKNICTLSLDASGDPLDRRGWRLDRNEAPLRETLAAAIMLHTGWDGSVPLLDPMCGSGTLLLEGASIALGRSANAERKFGLMNWPDFDNQLWQKVQQEENSKAKSALDVPLQGFDADPKSIITCRENARRADLSYQIAFDCKQFEEIQPIGKQGVLVMNPPYGIRMGDKARLGQLYRTIGNVLKQRFTGWTAYLLAGDLELAKLVGLKPSRRFVLFNGPLECRLLKYDLY